MDMIIVNYNRQVDRLTIGVAGGCLFAYPMKFGTNAFVQNHAVLSRSNMYTFSSFLLRSRTYPLCQRCTLMMRCGHIAAGKLFSPWLKTRLRIMFRKKYVRVVGP